MLTRRGFLQVLGASMAGAAVFEPKSLLWVPKPKLRYGLVELIPEAKASSLIDEQLELNDLARQIAVQMSSRLERSKAVALSEVMYRHTGSLTPGMLHVLDHGDGYFEPGARQMASIERFGRALWPPQGMAERLSEAMASNMRNCSMFAPIGEELRPGEPFSDCAVGLGVDPETGFSVRVLRYEMDRRGGKPEVRIGAEMAGGAWVSSERDWRHMTREERRIYQEHGREFWDDMRKAWPPGRDKEH